MKTTEWRKHTGTEMPSELAAAQIIEIGHLYATGKIYDGTRGIFDRADSAPWSMVMEYRPALTEDDLPYVSADGLEQWADYVANDEGGEAWQFAGKPRMSDGVWDTPWGEDYRPKVDDAPDTHAIPGDPEHSLARVWRE